MFDQTLSSICHYAFLTLKSATLKSITIKNVFFICETDQVVTRSTSGNETLGADTGPQRTYATSSSSGFINSAFESQTTSDYTSGLLSTNEDSYNSEKPHKNEDVVASEGTQLLMGKSYKYSAKGDTTQLPNDDSSSMSEDGELYEDLSSHGSSEDDESLDEKEEESFI